MERGIMIPLTSEEHARSVASFPVRFPSALPQGFELTKFIQWWPPWMTEEKRSAKVHADFVETTYEDDAQGLLMVTQGFVSKFIGLVQHGLAPADSGGPISLDGRDAFWLTALPRSGPEKVGGRMVIKDWEKGACVCVGWEDGSVPAPAGGWGDSQRYYSIYSTTLSLQDVVLVAKSVGRD